MSNKDLLFGRTARDDDLMKEGGLGDLMLYRRHSVLCLPTYLLVALSLLHHYHHLSSDPPTAVMV